MNSDQPQRIASHSSADTIPTSAVVVASKKLLSCEVGGESVLLDLQSGTYFGLNQLGAFIWGLVQQPTTVGDIYDAILNEYEVGREQCQDDVASFLRDMIDTGLIEVSRAPGS